MPQPPLRSIGVAALLALASTSTAFAETTCFPDPDSGGADTICDMTEYVAPANFAAYGIIELYTTYSIGETTYYRYLFRGRITAPGAPAPASTITLDDGSVYTPAPGTMQPVKDELWQNTRATCEGQACNSGMEVDDPDAIAFANEELSDASTSTAPPGVQIDPSSTPPPMFEPVHKTFHKDEFFGNGSFGGGYALDASLDAIPATGNVSARLNATAAAKVTSRVFGSTNDVLGVVVTAASDENSTINSKADIFVLGNQVFTKELLPAEIDEFKLFDRELYDSHTVPFRIFGYDVDVRAKVFGKVGGKITGSLSVAGPRLIVTPEAQIFGTASASVRIYYVFRVGVEGTLTLINVKAPILLTVIASSCDSLDFALKTDLILNSLSGKLAVFVKVKLLFIKKKKSVTITKWRGETRNFNLFTTNGDQPFRFICNDQLLNAIGAPLPPPPEPPPPPPPPRTCTQRPCPYTHIDE